MVLRRLLEDARRVSRGQGLDGVPLEAVGAGPVFDGDDLSPAVIGGRGGGAAAVELSRRDRRGQRRGAARAAAEAAAALSR